MMRVTAALTVSATATASLPGGCRFRPGSGTRAQKPTKAWKDRASGSPCPPPAIDLGGFHELLLLKKPRQLAGLGLSGGLGSRGGRRMLVAVDSVGVVHPFDLVAPDGLVVPYGVAGDLVELRVDAPL